MEVYEFDFLEKGPARRGHIGRPTARFALVGFKAALVRGANQADF
jgi:hypothetical protein